MPHWDINFDLTINRDHRQLIQDIATIKSVARTIRDIPVPPSVQEKLHAFNIVRAVRGTTGIEGTELSESEVSQVLNSDVDSVVLPLTRQREEREVRNAKDLMLFVEGTLVADAARPLTGQLICRFHEILTSGIDYEHNVPGKYRQRDMVAATYQTPNYREVPKLMSGFIRWLNQGSGKFADPIVQAIVAHFLLVSIHPFGDGNGRTSRGVESFLLYKAGVNVRGFYSLANYYYEHRSEYVNLLDHVRFQSDPDATPFVLFALKGLVTELEQVHSELLSQLRIVSFKDYAHEILSAHGRLKTQAGVRQLMFLLNLGDQKVPLTALRVGSHELSVYYSGVGSRTLRRDLKLLQELGLIVVEDGIVRAKTEVMNQFTASNVDGGPGQDPLVSPTTKQTSMFD